MYFKFQIFVLKSLRIVQQCRLFKLDQKIINIEYFVFVNVMSEIEENIEENFDNYICQFTQKRDCLDEVNDNDDENDYFILLVHLSSLAYPCRMLKVFTWIFF